MFLVLSALGSYSHGALEMDVAIVVASLVLTFCVARRFGVPGPGFWAILCALALASWRLRCSDLSWGDLGLRMPDNLLRVLGWVAILYVGSILIKVLVCDPLAKAAGWPPLNLARFSKLPGNAALLAVGLVLVWTQAAFGEEMVFRGFLLTRLDILLGDGWLATPFAVIGQALLFGVGHWYLGPRGVTTASLIGVVLGAVYVCNGRNLVPLIVAHGVTDSVSLLAIYARIARLP
jgi:membrane protease YdiL (CAAX protease family)